VCVLAWEWYRCHQSHKSLKL